MKKRKWVLGTIGLFFPLLIIGYGINTLRIPNPVATDLDRLEEWERSFSKDPTFFDCVRIFERIGHMLKEYERSIEYGKRCLELPREPENTDWVVHVWLAEFYNKTNNVPQAKQHLLLALQLDKRNVILENDWLSQLELSEIYRQLKP